MNSFFFFSSELIVNRILIVSIVVNKIFSLLVLKRKKKFPKGKFKLFNSFSLSVPCFSIRLISVADLIAVRYLWDVCNEDKCCVVAHLAVDILVALLVLFTFARIACLLQL